MPLDPESVGPVDLAVVVFEGDNFTGEMLAEMQALLDAGTIRLLDATFIRRGAEGDITIIEVEDEVIADALGAVLSEQYDLLSDEDLMAVAEGLPPATAALVLVWENTWARGLGSAMRRAGGTLVATERIPRETVLAAIAAINEEE